MENVCQGNTALLKLPKTAFLCSRKVPDSVVLKCYDLAIEQREKGNCVISGFQSQLEKDVLHYLLKGHQPIILVLARCNEKAVRARITKSVGSKQIINHFSFFGRCETCFQKDSPTTQPNDDRND